MKTIILSIEETSFQDIKEEISAVHSAGVTEEALQNSKNVVAKKIVYKSGGHKVVGFIVEPKNPVSGKLPCIIYNRGGTGEFGAIDSASLFLPLARMAQWGYVVIATQYSGNGGSEGADEFGGKDLEDVLNLYKVLQTYPLADATKIGMYGGSRGGMMLYLALTKVKWIKAAVSVYGLANLVRGAKERPGMNDTMKKMFGGSLAEKKKRSAVFWAHLFPKKTPLLLMHGLADWRVSPLDSLDLSRELYKYQIPHRLVLFEGNDHGLTENRKESNEMIKKWFDDYLVKEKPLPNVTPHGA
jgi:dipeptidyl aminopeptidase/acylaminoacyl peptidase